MNTKILKKLGERLKYLRKEKEYTQEFIAEKINVHPTYIGKIESGKINIPMLTLYKLAKALKTELYEIFNFDK